MMQVPANLREPAVLVMDDPLSQAGFRRVLRSRIRCLTPVLRQPKEFIAGLPPRDQIAILLCNTEVTLAQEGHRIDATDLLQALTIEDPLFSTIPLVLMSAGPLTLHMKGQTELVARINVLRLAYRQRGIEVSLLEKPFSYEQLLSTLSLHLPWLSAAGQAETKLSGTIV